MGEFIFSALTILFLWLGINGVEPLKDVHVIVPPAINLGNHATLTCLYDLDYNESLYTVKWYLNGDEFYRYVPKEVPPIQIFPMASMDVDTSKSDAHNVLLRTVRHEQTGTYKCEVSADAPFFDTEIISAHMTVVEFPENLPFIEVGKHRYEVGERIRANCSFGPSRPAANITWYINNLQVKEQFITEFPLFEDGSRRAWVKSSVGIDTDAGSFRIGRLQLKCIASVFSVNARVSEVQIEEEKPRSASVLGPKDSSGRPINLNSSGQLNPGNGNSHLLSIASSSSSITSSSFLWNIMSSFSNSNFIKDIKAITSSVHSISISNSLLLEQLLRLFPNFTVSYLILLLLNYITGLFILIVSHRIVSSFVSS